MLRSHRTAAFGALLGLALATLSALPQQAAAGRLFSLMRGHASDVMALGDGSYLLAGGGTIVQRVTLAGRPTRFAGGGPPGGPEVRDGIPATQATLGSVSGLSVGPDGSILIADSGQNRIRRVASDGTISTVAGSGPASGLYTGPDAGDGGPATSARLAVPTGVAALPNGGFLIADKERNVIRRVAPDGTISTAAGRSAVQGFAGDGGLAKAALLRFPTDVAAIADGGFLIADSGNRRVRRVGPDGRISTVAGNGREGFAGDGGAATRARLGGSAGVPNGMGVEPIPAGGFFIADPGNARLRRVDTTGRIGTVAGNGQGIDELGFSTAGLFNGEGVSALRASLAGVARIGPDPLGGWLVASAGGVSQLAGGPSRRIGVAVVGVNVARRRISLMAASEGSVILSFTRRGRKQPLNRSRPIPLAAGRSSLRLPRLKSGSYRVDIRATALNGTTDADRLGLVFGPRLPSGVARQVAANRCQCLASATAGRPDGRVHPAGETPEDVIDGCTRFGPRRIDCAIQNRDDGSCYVASVRLKANGLIYEGDYKCASRGTFRRSLRRAPRLAPVPLL